MFSCARSLRKLISHRIGSAKYDEPELKAMSGFKILSFLWLTAFLTGFYQQNLYSSYKEKLTFFAFNSKIAFVFLVSSYITVSLFFFMSAFFVTYSINKIAREFNGLSFLTVVQIYLNRLIRFIPLYYVVLLVSWVMLFA